MLSDEEKEALEILKAVGIKCKGICVDEVIINLIEKQSKEIEESEQKEKKAYIDGTNAADKLCNEKWEYKIKAKIEEINKKSFKNDINYSEFYYKKEVLQSLLEKE